MKKAIAKNVDEYIAHSPTESQAIQQQLRTLILNLVPGIIETISWGVPFYRYSGDMCGFAVYKSHMSFGVVANLTKNIREELKKLGYKTGVKTIQIQFNQSIPQKQIKELMLLQIKINNT
jgi:uncharacterized protein